MAEVEDFDLEYRVIDLDDLEENPNNPNVMSAPIYELLKAGIKKKFKDPIIVRPGGDGKFLIEDGHHRKRALRELGYTVAPCVIVTGDDELDLSALMLNKIKGRLDPSKLGALLLGLRESYSAGDLVKTTGFSSQDLERYASVLSIPELPDLGRFASLRFLRYAGGKFNVRHKIIGAFPEHRVYVEVFGGAGHILLNKPPSKIEVYNDLDSNLVNLFEVVRNRFDEFKEKFNGLLYSDELFEKFKGEPMVEGDPVESALRFYYILRASFFGLQDSTWGYSRESNHASSFWSNFEDLEKIWKRLQKVHVEKADFRKCITRWDSPETVFFVDPPYYGINYYKHGFEEADHEDLWKLLAGAVVGKWVLTYNHHPWVLEKYRGHELRLASAPLTMSVQRGLGSGTVYSNLVIMNYSPKGFVQADEGEK